jgi:hypothetical protein
LEKKREAEPSFIRFIPDARGFDAKISFGEVPHVVRLQPRGLPPLSLIEALKTLRWADPAVLEEILTRLRDEHLRAKALAALVGLELSLAFLN